MITEMIDKSGWGEGPWMTEPDRIEWEYKGLPCLMRRTESGQWCGYVALPPGHPCYEMRPDDVDVIVHGGLTYAEHCQGPICHVPKPGEPDDVWWLGFDCAHGGDVIPSFNRLANESGLTAFSSFQFGAAYRDESYVRAEVESLADQLLSK